MRIPAALLLTATAVVAACSSSPHGATAIASPDARGMIAYFTSGEQESAAYKEGMEACRKYAEDRPNQ